jgi:hypothetical protein
VKIVAAAIDRPSNFFEWAFGLCKSESATRIVATARSYLSTATWPWDKAFMLAGAYLAATEAIPKLLTDVSSSPDIEFPFWVTFDKHTDEGKVALRVASKQLGCTYRQLIWADFYFESALVNASS